VPARSDANTKIVPGHGDSATRDDFQRFHDMLVGVRANLKKLSTKARRRTRRSRRSRRRRSTRLRGKGSCRPRTHAVRVPEPKP
jgi:hypothetical protein